MTVYRKIFEEHGLSSSQEKIIELLSGGEVLEVGPSSGYMTKIILKKGGTTDIVEVDKSAAKLAKPFAREVIAGSIEDGKVWRELTGRYDFIVCADVLEHLVDPARVLLFLKKKLKKRGKLLVSIPNTACWNMRVDLMRGRFDYQESGLLDKTHLRFYTYNSFLKLLKDCGLKIENIFPTETKMPFELSLLKLPLFGKAFVYLLKPQLLKLYPNLIIAHYVVEAKVSI